MATFAPKIPKDPFEVLEEMGRTLAYSARMIPLDESLTPKEQRAELRATTKALAAIIPDARRLAAERTVREARERMDSPKTPPALTPAPAGGAPLQAPPRAT